MERRMWNQRYQALFNEAIGRELLNRLKCEGRSLEDLTQNELINRRYQIHLDFMYGTSAGETRAKQANLYRLLDVGIVPQLAETVPFQTPDLDPAA